MTAVLATEKFDEVTAAMVHAIERGDVQQADIRAFHRFTPGMYIRECRIPAGSLLVSEIHLTEHPAFIMAGEIDVFSENEGSVIYKAGDIILTQPGTRRILFAKQDTVWVTCHATTETDVEKIGMQILDQRPNPIIGDHPLLHQWMKNNNLPNLQNLLS